MVLPFSRMPALIGIETPVRFHFSVDSPPGETVICLTQSTSADTNPDNRIHSFREAGVPARLGQGARTREPPTADDTSLFIIPMSQHALKSERFVISCRTRKVGE